MQISKQSLDDNIKALEQQREQGLALYHQACGAIQLAQALQAQLNDALTEQQLGHILDEAQKNGG